MFAFNGSGQHCIVSADNRLRVWKGASYHQLVEKDHLKTTCTSVGWNKAGVRTVGNLAGSLIAMGFENGTITVWDLHRGVPRFNLGRGLQLQPVTDVAFSDKTLFSSSLAKEIIEWDLETGDIKQRIKGDKDGTTKLCCHWTESRSLLAAGSSSVRLVNLQSGKRGKKLPGGLPDNISLLEISPDGKFLASACGGGRLINIYRIALDLDDSYLLRTVSLLHSPTALSLHSRENKEICTVSVASCCDSGKVTFFRFDDNIAGDEDCASQTVDVSGGQGRSALGVEFHLTTPTTHVCIAHGSESSLPMVDVVEYATLGGKLSVELTQGHRTAALVSSSSPSSTKTSGAARGGHVETRGSSSEHQVVVLGPTEVNGVASSREVDDMDAASPRAAKRAKKAGEDKSAEGGNLSIAERLDALSSALASTAAASSSSASGHAVPTAESLATLLEQALHSLDDGLLEDCLAVSDPQVVGATIDRLTPGRVLPFLARLSDKVERSPGRATSLCVWMRAIMMRHASYLMSVPNLNVKLSGLYNILEGRTTVLPKLLSLSGRLELALSQISSQEDVQDQSIPRTSYDEEIDDAKAGIKDDGGSQSSDYDEEAESDEAGGVEEDDE